MGVDKGERAALAAKVDKGGSCLQVLCQAQCGGAGGKQGDGKEVHLCKDFFLRWIWSGVISTGLWHRLYTETVVVFPREWRPVVLVSQVFPAGLSGVILQRHCMQ